MMFPRKIEHRVAKFNKIDGAPSYHHDALEFPDGQVVLLTNLCSGQHATVLQLPAVASEKSEFEVGTGACPGFHIGDLGLRNTLDRKPGVPCAGLSLRAPSLGKSKK